MHTSEDIKRRLTDLLEEQESLLKLSLGKTEEILTFGSRYQIWYTKAVKIVELLGPDRLDDFVAHYKSDSRRKALTLANFTIQDFVRGLGPAGDVFGKIPFDVHKAVAIRVVNQFQILAALDSRIDSVLSDVTGHLLAELQDSELQTAGTLVKVSPRAAGALAGVVLERHLQRVAENHKISITKKNPTIADLNDPLKTKGVYDVPTWRKIQLLADLRNLCTHQKATEPTDEQVTELIAGVAAVVKSVF
jgi:hypothetical protein